MSDRALLIAALQKAQPQLLIAGGLDARAYAADVDTPSHSSRIMCCAVLSRQQENSRGPAPANRLGLLLDSYVTPAAAVSIMIEAL